MGKRVKNLEEEIYDSQGKWIEQNFGKNVALLANYGWGVDELHCEGFGQIQVETKVYGHGVLTSRGSSKENIRHEFQEF